MSKTSGKAAFLLNFCVMFAALPVVASAETKTVEALKFEQRSMSEGTFTVLISDAGVRVDFPLQNIVCLAVAPNWQAKVINLREKTGIEMSKLVWYDSGYHVADQKQSGDNGVQHAELWNGEPAIRLTRRVDQSDPLRGRAEMLFRDGNERGALYTSETILYGNWLKFKPEALEFLRGLYHLRVSNIVLQRSHLYPKGRIDRILDTLSFKHVTVPLSIFDDPIVYKKVATLDGVTFEKRRKKQAVGILEDLLDTSSSDEKPKGKPK
jgi:hypothetical protein